jgi:hypothetical protein
MKQWGGIATPGERRGSLVAAEARKKWERQFRNHRGETEARHCGVELGIAGLLHVMFDFALLQCSDDRRASNHGHKCESN